MSIQLIETYEEDSYIAVAAHVGALLDEGKVRRASQSGDGARAPFAALAACLLALAWPAPRARVVA